MSTEDPVQTRSPAADGRRFRRNVVAAGVAAGVTLAGLGIAGAQTGGSTTAPPAADEQPARPGPRQGFHHHGGPRPMKMGAIHGEFTTRAPGGGFQTLATQIGEVTAVSASSISVRSEDGFTRTYAVGDDTMVGAGDEGIDDVERGDEVFVTAVVEGATARAVDVHDATRAGRIRERWAPRPPRAPDGHSETS